MDNVIEVPGGTVSVFLDGKGEFGAELFSGLPAETAAKALTEAGLGEGPASGPVNAFLHRAGSQTTLIDAGGQDLLPGLGNLPAGLSSAGVVASEIDTIILTHVHPDHIGGLLNDDEIAFPNASLHLHEAELDFWRDRVTRNNLPDEIRPFFDFAQKAFAAYGNCLSTFRDEDEVAPGITAVHLPGHTPGHSGMQIGSHSDGILIWGDIVHAEIFQLPVPDAAIAFDVDQQTAVATRKAILERAASGRFTIAGSHLSGHGRIERAGNGFRLVREP